jgi:hypothetical protein
VNYTTKAYWHLCCKTFLALHFFWLAALLYSGQSNFEIEYLAEVVTEFKNILGYESGAQYSTYLQYIQGVLRPLNAPRLRETKQWQDNTGSCETIPIESDCLTRL